MMEKKNCQNPFPAILRRKKVLLSTKPRGEGAKGLSGLSIKKRTFLRLPLRNEELSFSCTLSTLKKNARRASGLQL